jgi:hypothetical protein
MRVDEIYGIALWRRHQHALYVNQIALDRACCATFLMGETLVTTR